MDWTTLTFNLAGNGKTRRETLNGVPYLVVPTVMITEGVHAGSDGPLLYEGKELGKTPAVWNMKPVTVYHPTAGSATELHCLAARGVGILMNTAYRPGKRVGNGRAPGRLTTEVWLQEDRAKQLDERITNAIKANTVMEVSTGLYVDKDPTPGKHEGKAYTARVTNLRPDHLAILPDQKGACSVAEGAGLLRNQALEDQSLWATYNRKFSTAKRKAMPKGEFAGPHRSFPIQTQEDVDNAARLIGHADDPAAVKARIKAIAKRKGLRVPKSWEKATTNAEQSTRQLHQRVGRAIRQHFAKGEGSGPSESYYLVDLYPQSRAAIYAKGYGEDAQHYYVSYKSDRKGNVSLSDDHEEVTHTHGYKRKSGGLVGNADHAKEGLMTKNQLVTALIANSEDWEEEDRPVLMGLPDTKLQLLHDKAIANAEEEDEDDEDDEDDEEDEKRGRGKGKPARNAATTTPTSNAGTTPAAPLTVEAYLASAPPAIRDVLASGLVLHDARRATLIQTVTANKNNKFTEEFLNTVPLDHLEALASLATPAPAAVTNYGAPRGGSFLGAAAGGVAQGHAAQVLNHKEEPMETPAELAAKAFAARAGRN